MMKKTFATLFAAALCLAAVAPAKAADNLTMADFVYTNALMVAGYTGSETLAEFPVLVRVSTSLAGFQYSRMRSSKGGDLAFFAEDGTRLASEVDTWTTSGTSLVWVKLPSMTQGTKFFMCYRLTDALAAVDTMVENPNPWTDYVGVWHLKETGATGVTIEDASTNALHGLTSASTGSGVGTGKIGRARKITTNQNNKAGQPYESGITVNLDNAAKMEAVDSLVPAFAASMWIRPLQDTSNWNYLLAQRQGDKDPGWGVQFDLNSNAFSPLRIYAGGETDNGNYSVTKQNDTASPYGQVVTAASPGIAKNSWSKLDVVWKSDKTFVLYVNGAPVTTGTLRNNLINNGLAKFDIGGAPAVTNNLDKGGRGFYGEMDEVRLRPGVPSADWVKADYETVTNEQFLIGPQAVTWDVGTNGGTMDVGGTTVTTSTNTVPLDFVPAAPGTPVKTGAVFLGWSTIPTATTAVDPAGFVANAPLTFYAVFADAAVRWFAADGTTPLDPAVTAVAAGSRPSHANPPIPPSTLYDRYTFEGWTRIDGDGSTVYQTAALPTVSAGEDISYKAVFRVEHSEQPDPSLLGFSHFAALKVAGYTGSAAVENFPVLVRLSETAVSGFLYSDLASPSDGADLAFFDAGGNPIAFEIDEWNPDGESLVWVRLPSMQNGTRFTIWWGSSEVTGKSVCPDNPWSDYTGVWHMNETGNGSSVVVHDATINRLDGSSPNSSAAVAAGPVGGARFVTSYQDNASSYNSGFVVDLSSDAAKRAAVDAIVPEFSASMWIRPRNTSIQQSQFEYLISRRAADKGPGWGAQFDEKSNRFSPLRVYSNEETDKADDGRGNPANVKVSTGASTGLAYQEWHKVDLAWTADGKYRIFVDGVQTSKDSTSTLVGGPVTNCLAATLPLCLGGSAAPLASGDSSGRGLYGDMDEVRLRPGALSADRALADFETVTNRNFLVNDILTIAWSDASGTSGFERIGARTAVIGGAVSIFGLADSCDIEGKIWAAGDAEPADWMILTNGIDSLAAFSVPVAGLTAGTTYHYALRAVGNDGETAKTVSGLFTTQPALTVVWSSATASPGLSKIAYDFATASGSVSALGDATACSVQAKVWLAGDSEPGRWTNLVENLAQGAAFNASLRETAAGDTVAPGTTYAYALRAVGNNGEETVPVTGTFTTGGEPDERIGSDYTHFFDDGTNAFWVVNGFERYLPFTVTGYEGTETLTNFPVLVEVRRKDTNGFAYEDFYHADGSDMAFVDEKGRIIPHEIDTWNKNGMSLIWVRLPEMVNGTTFTMCYRSPLLEPLPDVGNTFEKYVGVWHMNETQDGVASIKDSTVNNLVGESHARSLADSNGRVGYARRVAQESGTSSSNGRIMVFDHDDILRTSVGNVFTFSGWYKTADAKPNWAYFVSRKGDDYSKGWGIQYPDDNAKDKLRVWSDPKGNKGLNGKDGKAGGYYHFGITNDCTGAAVGYNHGDWAYWTFVFSNDTFHAYHNGTELESTVGGFTLEEPFANDETADFDYLVIGGMEFGTGAFNGSVDEARYSKGPRSDDWIKAEYLSTMQPTWWEDPTKRFVSKGTVSRGEDSRVPVVVWERGAGLPDTILDVSYAYVQFAGTVTYCGSGATNCWIEYKLWVDGESQPETWTTLASNLQAGQYFSIPVTGLKQDMLYNFLIRAVARVDGEERQNHEHGGQFRTNGNLSLGNVDGELFRVGDRFVHRYRAGSWIFTAPDYVTNVEIMVVGGGGAGGYKIGGGGGGGGLFYSASFPVETNMTYRIQVGEGGSAASDLLARGENGQLSYFARKDGDDEEDETILISVPGGGAGGSYVANNAAIAEGADGGSGGGGTYALTGGSAISNEVDGVWVSYGHEGGQGNDSKAGGNQAGKTAAGGGGGAAREGVTASFDSWYGGGAGGAGLGNSMTGELLFYGAGGGGGYAYRTDNKGNYSKPGAGGSGIGGNAADVRNETPATSGVENTGAGGGGGSMILNNQTDQTYWQGGDGGDGVVLIAYEAHGRDPISAEPRITMTSCDYTDEKGYADIAYRAYWAGIQSQTNDIYVLYSTVGEADVAAGNGELVKVMHGSIGIDKTTFTPPAVGYTYWVRLVARKDANSFMYSDEIASFEVPAIRLTGATWHMPANTDDNKDPSKDYANVFYSLYDTAPDARLYCYWSENRADLEGDSPPTGASVHFLDLGTGKAAQDGEFTIPATEGLERDKLYYIRLATGNEAGTKYFLSKLIVELETKDKPRVIFPSAIWNNHTATVEFLLTTSHLDPETVDLYALYGPQATITKNNPLPFGKAGVTAVNLGKCSLYPDDVETFTQFPLWSPVDTNYYVRLMLATTSVTTQGGVATTNIAPVCYSQRSQHLNLISAVPPNTLLVYVNADPKIGCYGDEPQPLTYTLSYGGRTEGPGWDHWISVGGSITGALSCAVTSLSPTGQYEIEKGTLGLSNDGQTFFHEEDVVDPVSGDTVTESVPYYYELVYAGSRYVVTNAQFSVAIADARTVYTGQNFNPETLDTTVTGLRNNQPVTYAYRVGANEWSDTITTTYSDIWTHIIQFKASAPNHDDARGTFMITIDPAPLSATISAANLPFTNAPQVPAITTNVTNHVRPDLNPLTSEFRDEAGEWQSEVPSFTKPGTYKLFYRVSAPNHTSFTTNCTFTVEEWDYWVNLDGQTGYPTPIFVTDPGWLLDVTKMTGTQFADRDTRLAKLDEVQPNGLKLWQNYVIERTDLTKKLVAAIVQSGSRVNEGCFVVHFPGVDGLRNTGLNIKYRLDRKLVGESEFTQGALTDKYETNVPLGPGDPSGLYVFNMVLTPTNGPGQSVLSSVTTAGVLRVTSSLTNTVTAVPWASMTTDSAESTPVSVAETVNPNGLSAGDEILAYDAASGVFRAWTRAADNAWKPVTTVTPTLVTSEEADAASFARGDAFWLVRSDSSGPFFLVGRHADGACATPIAPGSAAAPASTLCANPTGKAISFKDLVFNGEIGADDTIVVTADDGIPSVYVWNASKNAWGYWHKTLVGRRIQSTWVEDGSVSPGMGFWYVRRSSGALSITWPSFED